MRMKLGKLSFLLTIIFLLIGFAACQAGGDNLLVPTQTNTQPTSEPTIVKTITASPTLGETAQPTGLPAPTETQVQVEATKAAEITPPDGSLPDASQVEWVPFVQGLTQPVFIGGAGDGSGRLFVVYQTGQIMLVKDGVLQAEPFLQIGDRTTQPNLSGSLGERGLLGLAFDPGFAQNGYFYVNYTDRSGNTHISRFPVQPGTPDKADPASEVQLLYIDQPFPNHNGGALAFGPDGYLYVGLGDGGSAGDPLGNGQSLQTLLGKILRLNVGAGSPYTLPADNPFAQEGGLPEIWAYGLRNPWRISFDSLTGDLYIADVGQNMYEEINFQPAGSKGGINYGWNFREGLHSFQGTPGGEIRLTDPVAEYTHNNGCSVTGGLVYRGMNLPDWQGVYLYGDYCSGKIWGLRRNADGSWQNGLLFESGFNITSFGRDDAGEIYVTNYGSGTIYRLEEK